MIHPRESFKQIASRLAKALLKQWPFLEHLIVEKVRRKSSAIKSDYSSDDNPSHGLPSPLRKQSRAGSYQVEDPIEEIAD